MVNCYIRPANSSSKTISFNGTDQLRDLQELIGTLSGKGKVVLCGDFNSRIGNDLDYIDHDDRHDGTSYIPLPDNIMLPILTKRDTNDLISNSHKRPFLEMVINNGLAILNGRTTGDIHGNVTCIRPTGSSLIDYFITSHELIDMTQYLTVKPLTIFSDHCPLILCFDHQFDQQKNSQKDLTDKYSYAPFRYKFTAASEVIFKEELLKSEHQEKLGIILSHQYSTDREGAYKLNEDVTSLLQGIANKCLEVSKPVKKRGYINQQPWFNHETRQAKQYLNKAAKLTSEFTSSDFLRKNFYKVKKSYRKLCSRKKDRYFGDLNSQIEGGKVLNWKQFKKLKTAKKQSEAQFDSQDMANFENFFSDLYTNKHKSISLTKKEHLRDSADKINNKARHHTELNQQISTAEVTASIKTLKKGKSSSDDMIPNEFLKLLPTDGIRILCKLYNKCLDTGTYPWNNNIITPLHKKGCKNNPDNYRAVAVSSTIGKLFSTVILNRIIKFKTNTNPDPVNQLGFSKGAQTNDHILTLSTIVSKYKKRGAPIYAVFVDFKKAFDSVCREALFLKLAKLGITGKVFNTLKHMYTNSTGQIKLAGHISNKFDINKGTEQGHPISPDLFKIYIKDLSDDLDTPNCPMLLDQIISHLLWADDLILLALDPRTLQHQLDHLNQFCEEWGLEINVSKTKLMVFHEHLLSHATPSFNIGGIRLTQVVSYCYLGIEIHQSGSFSLARSSLKNKAMRALFSLKGTVNKSRTSFRSLTTLFDSLIKPVVLYGAPIWTPTIAVLKYLSGSKTSNSNNFGSSTLKKISQLNCERIHLHFLKWALGVNRKTSNSAVWGESGRYPLVIECISLTLNYAKRIQNLKDDSLVSLAFREQKRLKLAWYKGLEPLLKLDPCFSTDHVTSYIIRNNKPPSNPGNHPPPKENFLIHNGFVKKPPIQTISPKSSEHFTNYIILKELKNRFKTFWGLDISSSRKLEFLAISKSEFHKEQYLDIVKNYHDRVSTTRIRTSSHRLQIELGRHSGVPRDQRFCPWCNISMGHQTVENEEHFLEICDLVAKHRAALTDKLSQSLCQHINNPPNISNFLDPTGQWASSVDPSVARDVVRITSRFIGNSFRTREKFHKSLTGGGI